jgi:hypothetical protein
MSYEAPHYAIFSNFMPLRPSKVEILHSTPSVCAIPLLREGITITGHLKHSSGQCYHYQIIGKVTKLQATDRK